MDVLLSIKPTWVTLMAQGQKSVELRRAFSRKEIERVFIYTSQYVQKITHWFCPSEILFTTPEELWPRIKDKACVKKEHYDEYFANRHTAVGIFFPSLMRMAKPVAINKLCIQRPPQNFIYLNDRQIEYLMRRC